MKRTTGHSLHKFKIIIISLLCVFLLVIILGTAAVLWYRKSITPVATSCGEEDCSLIEFEVAEGQSSKDVAQALEEQGIIRSSLAYQIFMRLEGKGLIVQTGSYSLSKDMSVQKIAEHFNAGPEAQTFTITFLPGGNLSAARARLKEKGYTDEAITTAFVKQYDHAVLKTKPADASLEGYIYGETYEFFVGVSVEEILERTFDQLEKEVKENNLEEGFKQQGLTLHEGIVLASVVQRESGVLPDDMSKVAQVFLKRLALGIPLGSDAIIAYYADQQVENRDKTDMSYLETTPCPWNSRRCAGLPPTAIASPGAGALNAVAHPADTDYLYFLTGDDGKMYYGRTEAEHEQNKINYCQEMCLIL